MKIRKLELEKEKSEAELKEKEIQAQKESQETQEATLQPAEQGMSDSLKISAPNTFRVGDRIDVTAILADHGFVPGDIKYGANGYYSDQTKGTEFEAEVTSIGPSQNGEQVPNGYKIYYKGTNIEPMMQVNDQVKTNVIDLNVDSSYKTGWQLFHLTDSQNTLTPFPNLFFNGVYYGYESLSGGLEGYNGIRYDNSGGTGIATTGNSSTRIWSDFKLTSNAPTQYFCIKKEIKIDGAYVIPTSLTIAMSGYIDDGVFIFLRNTEGLNSYLFSDSVAGANNFSGNINLNQLTHGSNWLEVYATSGVFSGNISDASFSLSVPSLTIYSVDMVTKNRYSVDSSGNIYDNFGTTGWSNYWQRYNLTQQSNNNKVIDIPRNGSSGDDNQLFDYVVPSDLSDKIGTIQIEELDIIRYFFGLIDQGRTTEAVDLLDSSVAPDSNSKQQWKSAFDGFESAEVTSKEPFNEQSWTDSYKIYKVGLNIEIKPERMQELIIWNGQGIRWISIIKSDDSWKIGAIATGP